MWAKYHLKEHYWLVNAQHMQQQPVTARMSVNKGFHLCWNPVKKHSKALVFFAVSKQIPVVYSADRGRAENTGSDTSGHFTSVRFCLSYDHFKLDFIVFKVDIISVENATLSRLSLWCYMYAPKCYVTCGHTIFMTWHCPLNTTSATSYDKFDSDIVFCIRFWHCTLYEILVFKAHLS